MCRQEAEEFAAQRYTLHIGTELDSKAAEAKIDALRAKLERDIKTHVKIKVDADTAAAEKGLARTEAGVTGISSAAKQAKQDTNQLEFSMLGLALAVGPALIPLAGGLAGIATSALGFATIIPLAIKGANAEIQKGTYLGVSYKASIDSITGSLGKLEHTAANDLARPFQTISREISASTPQLQRFLNQISGPVGDTVTHLADGILHLFTAAEPLIKTGVGAIDSLATTFDHWAQGPGGTKFFDALQHDIPLVTDALVALGGLAAKSVAGLEPVGETLLRLFDSIATVANMIPQGVFSAGLTLLVAWKFAALAGGLATKGLAAAGLEAADAATAQTSAEARLNAVLVEQALAARAAATAQAGLAAEQGVAAAAALRAGMASGGLAGWGARSATGAGAPVLIRTGAGAAEAERVGMGARLAGAVSKAIPWIAADIALRTVPRNNSWAQSTNPALALVGGTGAALSDIASFHLGSVFPDILHNAQASQAARISQSNQDRLQLSLMYLNRREAGQASSTVSSDPRLRFMERIAGVGNLDDANASVNQISGGALTGYGSVVGRGGIGAPPSPAQVYAGDYRSSSARLARPTTVGLAAIAGQSTVAGASNALDQTTTALQKQYDAQAKLLGLGGKTKETYHGVALGANAYAAALAQTNNDTIAAQALLHATIDSQTKLSATISDTTTKQDRLSKFTEYAATNLKLSSGQTDAYTRALGLSAAMIDKTTGSELDAQIALKVLNNQFANGNEAVQGWISAISQINTDTPTLTDKVTLLGAGLKALQGVTVSMQGANLGAASSAEALANSIAQNSASVGKNGKLLGQLVEVGGRWEVQQPKLTAGSLAINSAMAAAGQSAIALAQSIYQNTGNASKAADAYYGLRQQFIHTETNALGSAKAAHTLADEVYGVPDKKFTQFLAKGDLPDAIASLTSTLTTFSDRFAQLLIKLGVDPSAVYSTVDSLSNLHPIIHVRVVNDTPSIDVNGGSSRPGGYTFTTNALGALYAAGGEDHQPQIASTRPGHARVWAEPETEGEAYIPLANDGRRPRARSIAMETVRKLGGVAFFADGGPPSLITDPTSSAQDAANKKAQRAAAAAAKKANTAYNSRIDKLSSSLESALGSLSGVATQSWQNIRQATNGILDSVRKVFAANFTDSSLVNGLRRESSLIENEAKRRDALIKKIGSPNLPKPMNEGQRLDAITQLSDTVRGAVMGQFDIGTSGNGYSKGILESLQQTNTADAKFIALRAQAKALGLSPELLQQITSEGPAQAGKNLQAIVAGGRGYVTSLDAQYATLKGNANTLADTQAKDTYGRTRTQEIAYIRSLMAQQHATQVQINNHLAHIRTEVHDLDRRLLARKRQG